MYVLGQNRKPDQESILRKAQEDDWQKDWKEEIEKLIVNPIFPNLLNLFQPLIHYQIKQKTKKILV